MTKENENSPYDTPTLYNSLISHHPEIERKGKTTPYT